MISSMGNAQVKEILSLRKKAKARKESGLFLVEG
ncbi:MAG: 23S rRNA (guanosine(2251)-2'-O)-methyltransferase RlmB, partial [bacterium]|nr:23S rRNA (guanosine(2251)-2'-O)-methyltransferase RlmB [bacterium]